MGMTTNMSQPALGVPLNTELTTPLSGRRLAQLRDAAILPHNYIGVALTIHQAIGVYMH